MLIIQHTLRTDLACELTKNVCLIAGQYLSECERHAEAAEQYVRAASLAPSEYEIIFNAANTLRQAGRHLEAEKYYRTAVKIRPSVMKSVGGNYSNSSVVLISFVLQLGGDESHELGRHVARQRQTDGGGAELSGSASIEARRPDYTN